MVGQSYNNAGLSEWNVAASSALICHSALTILTADGVVLTAADGGANNLGVLNGVFYTDATTNKPTWSNYSPASNTATDIVALINDNPQQMFEVMSADTAFNANEVGGCADQVTANGCYAVVQFFIKDIGNNRCSNSSTKNNRCFKRS
jgi:hypothetical protein